jgi:HPt (histidine-containing phosphotransfer) domain-containing protein
MPREGRHARDRAESSAFELATLSLSSRPLSTDSDFIVDCSRLEALSEGRLAGEPDMVPLLIETFAVDARERMARAKSSLLALNMTALARDAHALRGSAGLIGAELLRRDAERLERAARNGDADAIADLIARADASLAATLAALSARQFRE